MLPEEVSRLPMLMSEPAMMSLLGADTPPADVAEAILELLDRQAIHYRPIAESAVQCIEAWFEKNWQVSDVRLVDAASTILPTLGIGRSLLRQAVEAGIPETRLLAEGALAEYD